MSLLAHILTIRHLLSNCRNVFSFYTILKAKLFIFSFSNLSYTYIRFVPFKMPTVMSSVSIYRPLCIFKQVLSRRDFFSVWLFISFFFFKENTISGLFNLFTILTILIELFSIAILCTNSSFRERKKETNHLQKMLQKFFWCFQLQQEFFFLFQFRATQNDKPVTCVFFHEIFLNEHWTNAQIKKNIGNELMSNFLEMSATDLPNAVS